MSEQTEQPKQPRRRPNYRNRNRQRKKTEDQNDNQQPLSNTKPRSNKSRSSKPSNSNNKPSRPNQIKSNQIPKEESRSDEIDSLIYKLTSLKNITFISSNAIKKSLRIDIESESYRLIIPIFKKESLSIHNLSDDLGYDKFVIRNFNNKLKSNDGGLMFYVNYFINNYENLKLKPDDYKQYEINKLM